MVLIGYNQCVSPMGNKGEKSAMKFSTSSTSTSAAPSSGGGTTYTSAEVKAISIEAFKTTVYPINRARCIGCHGASQSPLHAVADVTTAHNAVVDNYKIDFTNIPSSRMVLKLKNDKHNCWSDCAVNATEMQTAITAWKAQIDAKAPTATDKTDNVAGKTTTQTDTVANILSPQNLIDQGTLTLMAEGGSLRAPMVKGNDNGTTYIWAPEGTGAKTLTSADAGLAYVNFKLTQSDFYKVWMLVNAPDTASDSMWVKVAGGDMKEWHIKLTKGFEWREVTTGTQFLDTPFYIAGGTNFGVELRQRDDGLKISKVTITNDQTFNPNDAKPLKSTITMPLATLSGVADSYFDVDIEEYDMYSYKLTNPRIRTSNDIYVKNLKVLVNGSFNPQHATYTIVNKKVSIADPALSAYSMILLKDKGMDTDRLSFTFEHIGTTPPPVVVVTPPVTTPGAGTVVTKLSSVAGFQQTLWPVLRARCVSCHGANQPPLHAAADVNVAHTNVIESGLVNFTNIPASVISNKLKNLRHNCWSDCAANAAEVEGQISIWKNLSGK